MLDVELRDLLRDPDRFDPKATIFMNFEEVWRLSSRCIVLDESEDEARVPPGFARVLGLDVVQDVVANAFEQKSTANVDQLLAAPLFYYDNDAFIASLPEA